MNTLKHEMQMQQQRVQHGDVMMLPSSSAPHMNAVCTCGTGKHLKASFLQSLLKPECSSQHVTLMLCIANTA